MFFFRKNLLHNHLNTYKTQPKPQGQEKNYLVSGNAGDEIFFLIF